MPISAPVAMAGAPLLGGLAGELFGGGGTQANVPGDLLGQRQQNIDLLSQLLGFGSDGGIQVSGKGFGARVSRGRGGLGTSLDGDPGKRLEAFFGSLTSPLQRQGMNSLSQFLSGPTPQQRAMDTSMPALQAILSGKPGQGIMDALGPSFQRNLASANQQGGRFSSGNMTMRQGAVDDFNLLGAQAAQQGQQTQLQAAQILGLLGGQAGNAQLQGSSLAGILGDIEPQRRIALLQQLLGTSQSATLGQPTTTSPSGAQQGLQAGFGIAQLIPFLSQIFGGGGGGMGGNGGMTR